MKHSFSILLTMCILMIIGAALIPRLDISNRPRPRQGKSLSISYSWPGASAKVVEQNVTSRIEGLVSSVRGVESVSSVSYFGSGVVNVQLKRNVSVSGVKFEIASLLRQVKDKLPENVSYPNLSGGEVVTGKERDRNTHLLSYRINAPMPDIAIRREAERILKPQIEHIDGIRYVDVSGGMEKYVEISYNAAQLALYNLTSYDIEEAIRNYLGRQDIVGDVLRSGDTGAPERIAVFVAIDGDQSALESIPVKKIDGKIIYINDLADIEYRDKEPGGYFRINGMNTVYMNVFTEEDVNISRLAGKVKDEVERITSSGTGLECALTYDRADEQFSEFRKLIVRSALSLLILLLFVFLIRRDVKYLFIIFATLVANILIAVICYNLFDMRLQPFSIAGITVSLGLIIDSTIVMVDHYSYHHDFKAYYGIVGAMLTTIGALVIIFWLPEYIKNDLYDFSWIIIINLAVALVVSALFAPALVDRLGYSSRYDGKLRHIRPILLWNRFYRSYVGWTQHRIMRWPMLALAAGLFGWSLYLFIDTLDSNTYSPEPEEMKLYINGRMPLGGTARQLNEKVQMVEALLSQYKEIKRYETNINGGGASIVVEFKPEYLHTSFPYMLENNVIGRLITIGGADWSTRGVSPRGFSNSLNMQYRSSSIDITGYDYDRLHRFAEDMCRRLKQNKRVTDLIITVPRYEVPEDELYMEYDREMLSLDSISVYDIHRSLSSMLARHEMGRRYGTGQQYDYVLKPDEYDMFDQWKLENSYIKADGRDVRITDFMTVNRRQAKNSIHRENQEYALRVSFNVLGSIAYTMRYIDGIVKEFNAVLPIGFRCKELMYSRYKDKGTQYWLIGLVVIIIFFICSILFESLYYALVIILLIPVSLTGMFLTYYLSGIPFGTGGFAAMVLLCGLTVNAGIYLMNEYNNNGHKYIKAYNHKIVPIMLTVFSTVLGLVPFLIDGPQSQFWFSLAVGSASGLLFSVFAIVFSLPLFLRLRKRI